MNAAYTPAKPTGVDVLESPLTLINQALNTIIDEVHTLESGEDLYNQVIQDLKATNLTQEATINAYIDEVNQLIKDMDAYEDQVKELEFKLKTATRQYNDVARQYNAIPLLLRYLFS